MKPEAQRIAIAKACGWKIEPRPEWPAYPFPAHSVTTPTGEFLGTISDEALFKKLPDYLNDLNAMHEAECMVTVGQIGRYLSCLTNIVQPQATYHPLDLEWWTVTATAAQRAEAFLKTLGLWKDE